MYFIEPEHQNGKRIVVFFRVEKFDFFNKKCKKKVKFEILL